MLKNFNNFELRNYNHASTKYNQLMYQLWVMTPRMDSGRGLVTTHTLDLSKTLNVQRKILGKLISDLNFKYT